MSTTSRKPTKRNQWPKVRHIEGRPRPWLVDCRIAGKGERLFFATATEADTKAEALRIARKNGGTEAVEIPARLREEALDAQRRLAALGVTITQAVDFYIAHSKPAGGEKTVATVVTEFLDAKRKAGRKPEYLRVQGHVLSNFARSTGERLLHEITSADIDGWMNGEDWSMRTRLNYFQDIRNFLGFAVRKGYRATNPMTMLEKPTVDEKRPGVLTAKQASAMLTAADAEMLPAIALGLFAGIRTSELQQLEWSHVDLKHRNIHVPAEVAKTREGRNVEILDNLAAWLQPYAKQAGRIAPQVSFGKRLAKTAKAAGIKWPKNALRHSFASHHYEHFSNSGKTAKMLGHKGSTQTFFDKYQATVTPSDAAAFWKIAPAGHSKKVVQMVAA